MPQPAVRFLIFLLLGCTGLLCSVCVSQTQSGTENSQSIRRLHVPMPAVRPHLDAPDCQSKRYENAQRFDLFDPRGTVRSNVRLLRAGATFQICIETPSVNRNHSWRITFGSADAHSVRAASGLEILVSAQRETQAFQLDSRSRKAEALDTKLIYRVASVSPGTTVEIIIPSKLLDNYGSTLAFRIRQETVSGIAKAYWPANVYSGQIAKTWGFFDQSSSKAVVESEAVKSGILNSALLGLTPAGPQACFYDGTHPCLGIRPQIDVPQPPAQMHFVDGELRALDHFQDLLSREDFFSIYGDQLGLSPDSQMTEVKRSVPAVPQFILNGRVPQNIVWSWNEQKYKGLKVLGAGYTLRLHDDYVDAAMGKLVTNLTNLDIHPTVAREDAVNIAQGFLKYPKATERVHPELVISTKNYSMQSADAALVWKIDFPSESLEINAQTQELWNRLPTVWSLDDPLKTTPPSTSGNVASSGHGFFPYKQVSGADAYLVKFIGYFNVDTGKYSLQTVASDLDPKWPVTITTYFCPSSLIGETCNQLFLSDTDSFTSLPNAPGVSVQWAFEEYLAYLHDTFTQLDGSAWAGFHGDGRNGAAPEKIDLIIVKDEPMCAAYYPFFDAIRVGSVPLPVPLDRHPEFESHPCSAISTIGHESTHGVIRKTIGLIKEGESGAMSEGIADIFGVLLRRKILKVDDWHAEDTSRFLDHPWTAEPPGPSYYKGSHYYESTYYPLCDLLNDFCGMHVNSSIVSYWFTLLANAVGSGTGEQILFDVLKKKRISPSASFSDLRTGTLMAAEELFPNDLSIRDNVAYTWSLVGVGDLQRTYNPPSGQENVLPWPVSLGWTVPTAEKAMVDCYSIQLATDPKFQNDLQTDKVCSENSDVLNTDGIQVNRFNLETGKAYYWHIQPVRPQNPQALNAPVPWGETNLFTTDPIKTTLISPSNTSSIDPGNIVLNWNAIAMSHGYNIEVTNQVTSNAAPTPNFSNPLVSKSVNGQTNLSIQLDLSDQPFYWQVQAVGPDNMTGAWSDPWAFSMDLSKVKPQLVSPTDAGTASGPSVTFQWADMPGVSAYQISLQDSGTRQWSAPQPITGGTSYTTATAPLAGCWKVQALVGQTVAPTGFSDIWCYTRMPGKPMIVSPTDGQVLTADTTGSLGQPAYSSRLAWTGYAPYGFEWGFVVGNPLPSKGGVVPGWDSPIQSTSVGGSFSDKPNASYTFYVVAMNPDGKTIAEISDPVHVTTAPAPAPKPKPQPTPNSCAATLAAPVTTCPGTTVYALGLVTTNWCGNGYQFTVQPYPGDPSKVTYVIRVCHSSGMTVESTCEEHAFRGSSDPPINLANNYEWAWNARIEVDGCPNPSPSSGWRYIICDPTQPTCPWAN